MTWPTATISTGDMDAGTDHPDVARAAIKTAVDQVNSMRDWLAGPRVDVTTHATSMDIGAAASGLQRWTGTAAVTTLGTSYDVPAIDVVAGGDFTIAHNSTTLVTPGGQTMEVKTGDTFRVAPKATSGTADGWQILDWSRTGHYFRATGCSPRTTTGTFASYTGDNSHGITYNNSTGVFTINRTANYLMTLHQQTSSIAGTSEGVTRVKFSNQSPRADVNWDWDSPAQSSQLEAGLALVANLNAGATFYVSLDAYAATAGTPSVALTSITISELPQILG